MILEGVSKSENIIFIVFTKFLHLFVRWQRMAMAAAIMNNWEDETIQPINQSARSLDLAGDIPSQKPPLQQSAAQLKGFG